MNKLNNRLRANIRTCLKTVFSLLVFTVMIGLQAEPSLEEKIGQMLIVGFPGSTLNEAPWLKEALHEGLVGGVILNELNKNIQSPT